MKPLISGYKYELANADNQAITQTLQFRQAVQNTDGRMVTSTDGVTTEDAIAVLLDRMKVLDATLPHACNKRVIQSLNMALKQLTARTLDRQARLVKGTNKP